MSHSIKLHYWDFAGYAEVSRLLLTGGNVPFEEVFVTQDTWKEFKPETPFGQIPVLEIDGEMLAQSNAINVLCAKLAGFYPDSPLAAGRADEICGFLKDMWMPFHPTWMIEDLDEKVKAREALLPKLKEQLTVLQKHLEGKEFVAGNKLSYGDLCIYNDLSMYTSGMMEGMPTTILEDYPGLKAFRNKIASIDFIKKYYAGRESRAYLQPDPEA